MGFETVPATPTSTLWTGGLVPTGELETDGARDLLHPQLTIDDLKGSGPVVSIGSPDVLRSLNPVDRPGFARVNPTDFYLVRLWCSFHHYESELRFDRARLKISLVCPTDRSVSLIAHDMHPAELLYKVKRDLRVTLGPDVKFLELGASVGSVDWGFSYEELQPQILAVGQGESEASRAFAPTRGRRLQGGKQLHLVVAAPRGTQSGEIELDFRASVTKPGFASLPMGLFTKRGDAPSKTLRARLW
jgi:hypothetical protein